MSKKIIICCDGTNNEISENPSNVLTFYQLVKKEWSTNALAKMSAEEAEQHEEQLVYYDTGVGTISDSDRWSTTRNKIKRVFGLATGYGLDDNLLDAYRFLVMHYQPADRIYLLGFSRGAYTVRILAGFIHMIGIMKPEQINLINNALVAYKNANDKKEKSIAYRFSSILDNYQAPIEFLGCWDTVGSVIVPRRFYLPSLEEFPHVYENTSVKRFRHAMSIDERRAMFNLSPWKEDQLYKKLPYLKDEFGSSQDSKQVWFAGDHSDIGGGYPRDQNGLANIALKWMLDEAKEAGIVFREILIKRLVEGKNPANATRNYSRPDPLAKLHDSMTMWWKIVEYLPQYSRRSGAIEKTWHMPRGEPRYIPAGATIHESVQIRKSNSDYDPPNLRE